LLLVCSSGDNIDNEDIAAKDKREGNLAGFPPKDKEFAENKDKTLLRVITYNFTNKQQYTFAHNSCNLVSNVNNMLYSRVDEYT